MFRSDNNRLFLSTSYQEKSAESRLQCVYREEYLAMVMCNRYRNKQTVTRNSHSIHILCNAKNNNYLNQFETLLPCTEQGT